MAQSPGVKDAATGRVADVDPTPFVQFLGGGSEEQFGVAVVLAIATPIEMAVPIQPSYFALGLVYVGPVPVQFFPFAFDFFDNILGGKVKPSAIIIDPHNP
jgi:hypothetical protein